MNSIVIYSTKSGNTGKVAREIASELGCPCVKVSKDFDSSTVDLNEFDVVFIGTGIYKGQPHADLVEYLERLALRNCRSFALFMTCFGWGKGVADKNVVETLRRTLEAKGQRMLDSCFKCYGEELVLVKRGHPDASELGDARKWAREITEHKMVHENGG